MAIARLVEVVNGVIDLWTFHPAEMYSVEQRPDGVLVLTPATAEQRSFAAQVHAIDDEQDPEPGVTIRPLYGTPE